MLLYLFGGAEIQGESVNTLKKLINQAIAEIKPKQLLHIPYARIIVPLEENNIWGEGWVKRDLNLTGIDLLDARKPEDLARADHPLVFINGGTQRDNLYQNIISNNRLYRLVVEAEYLISESSGSMVTGEFRRTYDENGTPITTQGLGILKDTLIEGHYSQRNRQQAIRDEMKHCGAAYGIGIDSATAIVIDTQNYPQKYRVLGDGLVEFIRATDL